MPKVIVYDFAKDKLTTLLGIIIIILAIPYTSYALSKLGIPQYISNYVYVIAIPLCAVAIRVWNYYGADIYLNLGGFVIPVLISLLMMMKIFLLLDVKIMASYLLSFACVAVASYLIISPHPYGTFYMSPDTPVILAAFYIFAINSIAIFVPPWLLGKYVFHTDIIAHVRSLRIIEILFSSASTLGMVIGDYLRGRQAIDKYYLKEMILGGYGVTDIIFIAHILFLFFSKAY